MIAAFLVLALASQAHGWWSPPPVMLVSTCNAEKQGIIHERNVALVQKNAALIERDSWKIKATVAEAERDAARTQRDTAEAALKDKRAELTTCTTDLNECTATLAQAPSSNLEACQEAMGELITFLPAYLERFFVGLPQLAMGILEEVLGNHYEEARDLLMTYFQTVAEAVSENEELIQAIVGRLILFADEFMFDVLAEILDFHDVLVAITEQELEGLKTIVDQAKAFIANLAEDVVVDFQAALQIGMTAAFGYIETVQQGIDTVAALAQQALADAEDDVQQIGTDLANAVPVVADGLGDLVQTGGEVVDNLIGDALQAGEQVASGFAGTATNILGNFGSIFKKK